MTSTTVSMVRHLNTRWYDPRQGNVDVRVDLSAGPNVDTTIRTGGAVTWKSNEAFTDAEGAKRAACALGAWAYGRGFDLRVDKLVNGRALLEYANVLAPQVARSHWLHQLMVAYLSRVVKYEGAGLGSDFGMFICIDEQGGQALMPYEHALLLAFLTSNTFRIPF